jgi:glucokinase
MELVLREECLPAALEVCTIVPAELGERIGDVAALVVAQTGMETTRKNKLPP